MLISLITNNLQESLYNFQPVDFLWTSWEAYETADLTFLGYDLGKD